MATKVLEARSGLPSLAERKRIRTEAGWSIRRLARELGRDASTVFRWESGERIPGVKTSVMYLEILERLADEAGTPIAQEAEAACDGTPI